MCDSGIVVPRATHYKMGLRNKCSGYEVLHTLIAYALSPSEHRRISGFCFTSAEWSKSLKSVRVCRLILYALASLFILFHYQKSELHCTRRLCLSVFLLSIHSWHERWATSFPGSLILPPPEPSGKVRDPGNEVGALGLSLRTHTDYRLRFQSVCVRRLHVFLMVDILCNQAYVTLCEDQSLKTTFVNMENKWK